MALPQLTTHHSEVERGHPAAGRARSEPSAATPLLAPTPRRILVVHLAGFGDLVMGLPALHALRRGFPESRIELLTWARNRDVVELLDCLDAAHFLDPAIGPRPWPGAPLAVRHSVSGRDVRPTRGVGAGATGLPVGLHEPEDRSSGLADHCETPERRGLSLQSREADVILRLIVPTDVR